MNRLQFRRALVLALRELTDEVWSRTKPKGDDFFVGLCNAIDDEEFLKKFIKLPEIPGAGPVGSCVPPPEQKKK